TSANAQIFHSCAGASGSIQNIRSMRESTGATWLWEKVSSGSLYYSTGTNGAGTNKIRFAVNVGEIYLGDANKRVYHEGFKPTKADVGLGSVNDWGATGAINDASDAKYATAGAVKKAYDLANGKMTQAQGDARYYRFIKALGSADNLNNIVATGIYHNSMNANATAANNYPTTNAGYLEVFAEGSMVYQRYHSYQANNHVYYRGRYNSTWSAWRRAKGADESTAWSTLTGIPVQATRWPTSSEVGLGSVNNWPATAATNDASDAKYATAGAVKKAYDLANGKAPASHNHAWGNITGVPVYATRWPTAAEAGAMAAGGTYGTVTFTDWVRTSGNCGWYNATHGGGMTMQDGTWVRVSHGKRLLVENTAAESIQTSGGVYAGGNGNYNDVHIRSDRRLKSNFEPITDALEKVSQLYGQLYDKAGVREAGLIAQDVQAVQPESVHENKEGMLTIAPAGVVALLVEAVKELRSENIALKARLDQMGA
ncbi:MAG: tail fiber domain-containing protein, partial [Plesiomonas shigelloides]